MKAPVFYDPSGKRKRWSKRTLFAVILALVVAVIVFALTIVNVPTPSPLNVGIERPQPRPLPAQIAHVGRVLRRTLTGWLPSSGKAAEAVHQQVVGFYVPWDDSSRASLIRHIGQMDWLVPVLGSVTGKDHHLTITQDRVLTAILHNGANRPKIFPLIQNAAAGDFDGPGMAALLHDPRARKAFLDQVEPMLAQEQASGVVFDMEDLPQTAQRDYLRFIVEARRASAPRGCW